MNIRLLAIPALILMMTVTLSAQPPFGGDRGGGDRGGRGGGPPGGDRGSRGGGPGGDRGSRGGFDPSSFLDRLDANKNGVLDPEEQQGPAQFLITRLQQADPSITAGKPIPISKIKEGFEKMRGGGSRGDDSGGRDSSSNGDDALMAELLVPGFGIDEEPIPILGFGPTAEMLSVPVTDADRKEAGDTLRRYDRNKNGTIEEGELSSRFTGNPMDFDRNRDGKLSVDELAVRYARRREGREEAKKETRTETRSRDSRGSVEIPDVFGGRQSFRIEGGRRVPEGLPGFFKDKDADGDGQVSMAEFASDWSDEVVKEFFDSDFNRDGRITAEEALRAIEEGPASKVMAAASSGSGGSPSGSGASSGASSEAAAKVSLPTGKVDPKYVKVIERIFSRSDKNGDGALTESELEGMLMRPKGADYDRDGRITINEYAMWMQARQKKL